MQELVVLKKFSSTLHMFFWPTIFIFQATYCQKLLLFDALRGQFRSISLRPRSPQCLVCGDSPSITKLIDYEQFCGTGACDKVFDLNTVCSNFLVKKILPVDRSCLQTDIGWSNICWNFVGENETEWQFCIIRLSTWARIQNLSFKKFLQ